MLLAIRLPDPYVYVRYVRLFRRNTKEVVKLLKNFLKRQRIAVRKYLSPEIVKKYY